MKRLVAHLRVFFDKRSGKAERIEQFIAEHGIEYGLQFGLGSAACKARTPLFPQFPRLPLYKEILQILAKLRKVESKTKEFILFFAETE